MDNFKFDIGERVLFTYLKYFSMYTREYKTKVGTIVSRRKQFFGLSREYAIAVNGEIHMTSEDNIWKYIGDN